MLVLLQDALAESPKSLSPTSPAPVAVELAEPMLPTSPAPMAVESPEPPQDTACNSLHTPWFAIPHLICFKAVALCHSEFQKLQSVVD